MLTTTPAGWWLPSPNSATRIASPNSVSSLISIANPGVAGVLVCFVVRAICLSPCMTIHHFEADHDQGNSSPPGKNRPDRKANGRRALKWRRPGRSFRYSGEGIYRMGIRLGKVRCGDQVRPYPAPADARILRQKTGHKAASPLVLERERVNFEHEPGMPLRGELRGQS